MNNKKIYVVLLLVLLSILTIAQNKSAHDNEIITIVEQIDSIPVPISFQNSLEVNNNGGHLQGVQYYEYNQNGYYFLTGSSDKYSYYSVLKMDQNSFVISINKILDKPFKHAGGFQIYQNLMAIGVEDNSARDRSKVFIYRIENPEKPPSKPLAVIERSGKKKRATAGCVGIIEVDKYILVVVGDWDTKHLDFYRIEKEKLFSNDETFKLVHSIDAGELDKSEWVNNSWLSYQNINLIKDSSGKLYLAGLGSNDKDENILDLFSIETEGLNSFNLKKIHTKIFIRNKEVNFDWGAGVYMTDNNQLKVFSCEAHIQKESRIYVFE
ncbi:hypothetical protein MNBD_IGNAVI01-489 [hydrothermal vent metagenome]|uniref:Gll0560 protein n=1 Tax=hydrothermal vent metagenome TaxID=652676 RepID=A0A3B1BC46_9ZZZZ